MNKKNYRPDIDGLRAIAVLAVIFYHLDVPFISGGFIGVDIFFVISGYLISSIIYGEINSGSFSLGNFYIRRIRRIFPALFFIVFITTCCSFFLLPQVQLGEFSKSIISISGFVSNIFFSLNSDYFSVAAELKPLLHTWSLSVEEQFYVFFPLLMLMLVNKYRYQVVLGILLILLLSSFVLSLYLADNYATANFYIAPTRAWEFLLGTLLAIGVFPDIRNRIIYQFLALFGSALILGSIVLLNDQSVFPGVNALYPVLGTAMLIYSGLRGDTTDKPLVLSLLSTPALRYTGLISYSLYLWHWPIIALLKNQTSGAQSFSVKIIILLTVFILSALSYQFIERPFRYKPWLTKFISIKSGLLAMLFMSIVGGSLLIYTTYYNVSANEQLREQILTSLSDLKTCFLEKETLQSVSRCSFGDQDSTKVFLLWGDSHTLAMYPAFVKLANDNGWRGIHASIPGCPPLLDVIVDDVPQCNGLMARNIKHFLLNNKVDAVFLVSHWSLYETGWFRNGRLMKPHSFVSDDKIKGVDAASSTIVLHRAIRETLQFLLQIPELDVHLLLPTPVLPRLIDDYTPQMKGVVTRKKYIEQRSSIVSHLKTLRLNREFNIIDPINVLCEQKDCPLFRKGQIMYVDDNHLSPMAAISLLPLLEQALEPR